MYEPKDKTRYKKRSNIFKTNKKKMREFNQMKL